MKNLKFIIITFLITLFGCSDDFLERIPEDGYTAEGYFKTDEQVYATSGVLYGFPWFEFNDKAAWTIGDIMSGNIYNRDNESGQFFVFGVTAENVRLNEAWNSFYRVIAHANALIKNVEKSTEAGLSEEAKLRSVAEAKFMRATAYFYLVRLWGAVPVIMDSIDYLNSPKVPRYIEEDIYRIIREDLMYAENNLPDNWGKHNGRVTNWSAKGMLAKVYLTMQDYENAKTYCEDVIQNSWYSLEESYPDLFIYTAEADDDNNEALFAFQWIACDLWGTQNTFQSYFAPGSEVTGVGDGWGSGHGPTLSLQNLYDSTDTRRKASFMKDGDRYPEIWQSAGGYVYEGIDDDGAFSNRLLAAVKKYVIGKPEDNNGEVCNLSTGIDSYILRLADVYLMYCEAAIGDANSTTDPKALEYFHKIRQRAHDSTLVSELHYDTLMLERRKEFAFEGQYWYDLLRYHNRASQQAIQFINSQNRGYFYERDTLDNIVINTTEEFHVSEQDFKLVFPQVEVTANPLLNDEPVPFFSN